MKRDLLSLAEWKQREIEDIINNATKIKENPKKYSNSLKNKTLLMIFEKPSLRTRVSFEVGMTQLGGHAIFYDVATSPLGRKETIEDTAKTASKYVNIIMARLFKFEDTKKLAQFAAVPVIDALSDMNHPCQIIADLQTIKEKKGKLKGLTLAYFGDAKNNVTYSLLHGCALTGMNMKIACPDSAEAKPKQQVLNEALAIAKKTGSKISIHHNAIDAAKDADIVYTDSWMSYHIPKEKEAARVKMFKPFQVTAELMKHAKKDAIFMNCLPARRGYEQTADVIDGSQSIVFDQAENRLHSQKAIILYLLGVKV